MTLVENSAYPWCSGQSWVSPRTAPTLALGWAEGPGHLPPPLLWLSALGVLSGASHPRMSPPQACKRLHASSVYGDSGTGCTSLGVYPKSDCNWKGVSIWFCQLPDSVFQHSVLKCGQPPAPIGLPPWLPGGTYHVSHPSLRSENGVWFGSWAAEWPQHPPFGPLPAQWYLPSFVVSSSRKTECLWWPFPSIWAHRAAG